MPLDRCLSRLRISQEIPFDLLTYLSHRKEIKCAFRFIAESGLMAPGVQLGATQSSFHMVIYMQLSATHELQSATQKHLNGCLSCTELH